MKLILIAPATFILYEHETHTLDKQVARIKDLLQAETKSFNMAQHVLHLNSIIEAVTDMRNEMSKFVGKKLI